MKNKVIMLVPTTNDVSLTGAVLGVFRALQQRNIAVHFFKPIQQKNLNNTDDVTHGIMSNMCTHPVVLPISAEQAEHYIAEHNMEGLLGQVVVNFEVNVPDEDSIILIEGLAENYLQEYARGLNTNIAQALDADIVLVSSPYDKKPHIFDDHLAISADVYGVDNISGVIVTNLHAPLDENGNIPKVGGGFHNVSHSMSKPDLAQCKIFKTLPLIGATDHNLNIERPRALDVLRHLNADVINAGDMETRRITDVSVIARNIENAVEFIKPGALIFTPADRSDVIMTVALQASMGVKIGALVLTGREDMLSEEFTPLWMTAFKNADLPVFATRGRGTWEISRAMMTMNSNKPIDDVHRLESIAQYYSTTLNAQWVTCYVDKAKIYTLTPPAFKHQLITQSQSAPKRIVLPEGDEPRTIEAATIVASKGIAECYLLGNRQVIRNLAKDIGVNIDVDGLHILDADALRCKYVDRLMEIRVHKAMNKMRAVEELEDNVVLGTMMLEADEMDGLVSGAVHTTANTIRPPLQIIKTAPHVSLVSSVLFMCLPDQVLVYGDCAINPDPTAEHLADIAIQSADSAKAFGIDPKVAMISYSTGTSGTGKDVDKVVTATALVKNRRPDIVIDGPLQYDAAIKADVAKSKAPNSPVAGQATVFIFPDLNTGNTTYKAVQRSTDCVSIGPMLQGMNKPVNDLSRGALVEDIVYTIALTTIQAQ